MPEAVTVCECWARDGLQSWPEVVPTAEKLRVLRAALDAGFTELELTSLVPTATTTQFFDAEEVLRAVPRVQGVRYRVLAPNVRGVERAIGLRERTGAIDVVGFPISASESHNVANLHRNHNDQLAQLEVMIERTLAAGMEPLAGIATSFGCPIVGHIPEAQVFWIADWLVEHGVRRLMFSDTTGLADPIQVASLICNATNRYPDAELVAHFHDTRGSGILNTWTAILHGATTADTCLNAIGGEPPVVEQNHSGETGNTSTEDLVVLLERAGVMTGIDVDALVRLGHIAESVLGRQGRSQVLRTGHGMGNAHS
jgi:hydroxymethylglutaryl-CoA lyase